MATIDRTHDRGQRRGERLLRGVADELRTARRAAGLSQAQVARHAGISQAELSRVEHAASKQVSVMTLARLAEVVGLELVARTYPGQRRIRDQVQASVLLHLSDRLGPAWRWRFEVLVAAGDQRAWDALARHVESRIEVVFEVETRLEDIQALLRRIA